jgi:hypothetical protein
MQTVNSGTVYLTYLGHRHTHKFKKKIQMFYVFKNKETIIYEYIKINQDFTKSNF